MNIRRGPSITREEMAAAQRVLRGEDAHLVAHEYGVATSELRRWVARLETLMEREAEKDARPGSEELKRLIAAWAPDFGYVTGSDVAFHFPAVAGTKSYNPDAVWCDGNADEKCAAVIFEVDGDVSVKHRVGGAALANIVALMLQRRLHYFAVAPTNRRHVATTSIEVLQKYLGDRWMLMATVVATFEPDEVRAHVTSVLGARPR